MNASDGSVKTRRKSEGTGARLRVLVRRAEDAARKGVEQARTIERERDVPRFTFAMGIPTSRKDMRLAAVMISLRSVSARLRRFCISRRRASSRSILERAMQKKKGEEKGRAVGRARGA